MGDLIALGGAKGVWDELGEALELFPHSDVGAVNDAGKDYPGRLTVWATLHANDKKLNAWQRQRALNGFNTDYVTIANKDHPLPRVDRVVNEYWSGTSGLYLVQVALFTLGYDRVICCGMPLTQSPHYFSDEDWKSFHLYRRGWMKAAEDLNGRVKSMSGWTRELLGHPRDWLTVSA